MEGFKKDRKFSVLGLAVLWDRTQGLMHIRQVLWH